ncbi:MULTISPECIES: YchJ family protein [unclassified Moraxella]|uniref:YchJ family protein n=1 Tax=unclassified Moraxella TaxID=2685852 RepID=UPI003AF9277E
MSNLTCSCGSAIAYSDCCEPLHLGVTFAQTAEALMRSRYTAFVRHKIDYIVATTTPFQQALLDKTAIANWAEQTDWVKLEVIKHTPKMGKHHAQVEFKAYFNTAHGQDHHHELSSFVKIAQAKNAQNSEPRWYFLDPTVAMSVTQKQPCPCASGEKYKRCCGQFL